MFRVRLTGAISISDLSTLKPRSISARVRLVALLHFWRRQFGHVGHQHQLGVHELCLLERLFVDGAAEQIALEIDLDYFCQMRLFDLVVQGTAAPWRHCLRVCGRGTFDRCPPLQACRPTPVPDSAGLQCAPGAAASAL